MDTNSLTGENLASQVLPVSLNLEQATSLIIERARHLVNLLVKQRGHEKPPFSPEEFAPLQGIKRIVKANLGEPSAVLLRFHDGYEIRVNQEQTVARQNFSCAHEIGHILFDELKLERYVRTIEYRQTYNPQGEKEARATARERLCDAAAVELLMPKVVFSKYLSDFGLSMHSVEGLASIFRVSIQTATIRVAELSTEPCIALLWRPWPRNKPKVLRLAWRIGPEEIPRGKDKYMPLDTIARHNSTLYKAYQDDNLVRSHKNFKLDTVMKRCPMESKGFSHGETRYVISLAFPDR